MSNNISVCNIQILSIFDKKTEIKGINRKIQQYRKEDKSD